jgi:hypothetical protein
VIHELRSEGAEEALCDGIVPTISLAAHARHEAVVGKSGAVVGAGVGASPDRSGARGLRQDDALAGPLATR